MTAYSRWKEAITGNFSTKMVALFISLILWLTILGRRDFVHTREVEVELVPGAAYSVTQQTPEKVRLRVSGPRAALRKFLESPSPPTVLIDVSQMNPGEIVVEVPLEKVELPFGVKALSVKPHEIHATLTKKEIEKDGP